jgi:hypothetical protein
MCHCVAVWTGVSRCPRTYSGRRPAARTVGVHRRLFHGQPQTGRAGRVFRLDMRPLSLACIPACPRGRAEIRIGSVTYQSHQS